MTGPSSDRATTCHCGQPAVRKHLPDQWEGRMDGYCDACASNRCDCYPDECPVKYPPTGPSSERTADADVATIRVVLERLPDSLYPSDRPHPSGRLRVHQGEEPLAALDRLVARNQQLQEALAGTRDRDRFGDIDIGPCWCPDWKTEEWHGDDPDEYVHHPACARARAALASVCARTP